MRSGRRLAIILGFSLLAALIIYVMADPLPEIRQERAVEEAEGESGLLPGSMESMEISKGRFAALENRRRLWEISADGVRADKDIMALDTARAVLFRQQLPDLTLTAPRIDYLPAEKRWQATGGISGDAEDIRLRMGRLEYDGRSKSVRGDDGVSLSGKGWRLRGSRAQADADFSKLSVSGRARLEYDYD